MYRGCSAGTHPCDATLKMMRRQSANSCGWCCVVVWCCREVECNMGDETIEHEFISHTHPRWIHCAASCGRPIRRMAPPRCQRSSLSFTRRDQLVKLGVDAHRLLAVKPTVLVERLALDVLVCITSCSVVPQILACRQCHNRL